MLKKLSIEVGHIYLFGERAHGDAGVIREELEIWGAFYALGHRHLFEELPYFTAALLNEWMADDSDAILDKLYQEWEGTDLYNSATMRVLKGKPLWGFTEARTFGPARAGMPKAIPWAKCLRIV